jgi:hypothetical protein
VLTMSKTLLISKNNMEYTVKIFERPEMENPVYKVTVEEKGLVAFIQRHETNDYDEWNEVVKNGGAWELKGTNSFSGGSSSFLGFTKKEAISRLI